MSSKSEKPQDRRVGSKWTELQTLRCLGWAEVTARFHKLHLSLYISTIGSENILLPTLERYACLYRHMAIQIDLMLGPL